MWKMKKAPRVKLLIFAYEYDAKMKSKEKEKMEKMPESVIMGSLGTTPWKLEERFGEMENVSKIVDRHHLLYEDSPMKLRQEQNSYWLRQWATPTCWW